MFDNDWLWGLIFLKILTGAFFRDIPPSAAYVGASFCIPVPMY